MENNRSITFELVTEVMSAFTSDTFSRPNTREIREIEFKDCDLTFEPILRRLTPEDLKIAFIEMKVDQHCSFSSNKPALLRLCAKT